MSNLRRRVNKRVITRVITRVIRRINRLHCSGHPARFLVSCALAAFLSSTASTLGAQTSAAGSSGANIPKNVPTIRAMRARLFENKKSEWSADLLASDHADLRNSNAGLDASNATLVIVEVGGRPGGTYNGYFGAGTKYSVRLEAREGKQKTLLDETQLIPVLDQHGTVHLAFLLHQSGCTAVQLRASIVGQEVGKPVERTLNFTCGE